MKKGYVFPAILNVCAFALILCTLICYAVDLDHFIITDKSVLVNNDEEFTVVIDPGHGGIDAGAVGVNGVLEKDLNLRIALLVSQYLEKSNVRVILTRTDDRMLSIQGSRLSSKAQDLKARVDVANSHMNGILVSIHMNKFSDPSVNGLQVWHSDNGRLSEILAQTIQKNAVKDLQSDNKRQIKSAGSSIYVLHKSKIPAVLVECGFISNSEEAERLSRDNYQKALAKSIANSILTYLGEKNSG